MMGLCNNYLACKAYQQSYHMGCDECAGCDADIRGHRFISDLLDRHIDALADKSMGNSLETITGDVVDAWRELRHALESEGGLTLQRGEEVVLLQIRTLQRLVESRRRR